MKLTLACCTTSFLLDSWLGLHFDVLLLIRGVLILLSASLATPVASLTPGLFSFLRCCNSFSHLLDGLLLFLSWELSRLLLLLGLRVGLAATRLAARAHGLNFSLGGRRLNLDSSLALLVACTSAALTPATLASR